MSDKENGEELDLAAGEETLSPDAQSEAEAWHENLPPEDDFQDQTDFSEDSVDEDTLSDSEMPLDQEGKRRGRNVFLAAIVVGFVVLGAFVYLQFTPKASTTGSFQPIASVLSVKDINKPIAPTKPSTENEESIPGLSGKTERVDMISLYQAAKSKGPQPSATALPMLKAEGQESDKQKSEEIQISSIVAGNDVITQDDKKQSDLDQLHKAAQDDIIAQKTENTSSPKKEPSLAQKKEVTPAIEAVESQPAVPTPSQAEGTVTASMPDAVVQDSLLAKDGALLSKAVEKPLSSSPVVDEAQAKRTEAAEKRLKEMESQMDALQKSLAEANERNAQLVSKLETVSAKQVLAAADLKSDTKEVAGSTASAPAKKPAPEVTAEEVKSSSTAQTKPAVKATTSKKTAKKKETKTAATKTGLANKAEKQKVSNVWVLRAVTPEAAWIATSPVDPELRQIAIGEEAPGIGVVKEITRKGEAWQVVGEKGVIK